MYHYLWALSQNITSKDLNPMESDLETVGKCPQVENYEI